MTGRPACGICNSIKSAVSRSSARRRFQHYANWKSNVAGCRERLPGSQISLIVMKALPTLADCAGSAVRIFVFMLLVISLPAAGREAKPPMSWLAKVRAAADVPSLVMPPVDVKAELAADAKAVAPGPLRYAVSSKVFVTPQTHGLWEDVAGGRLWRLRVISEGATDLNFGFSLFWLPEGATLHIYSETEQYFQGPFTAQDNKPHGQLWTPVVPGGVGVIELFVPEKVWDFPRLELWHVGLGYRDLFHKQPELPGEKAGSCNIDVICPQGDQWRNEIRSVARYSISGGGLCTGTLVMNTARDFKNYFLTANHCDVNSGNAASVVVYWNFQSPTCGQHGGGSLSQNQSGAIFRAAKADVDFALLELEDVPDASFQVYYAGWDRSGNVPNGAVCIHHPNGDEKSISFSTTPLGTVDSCIGSGGSSTHWQVIWSTGTTEPGSSGSAIWDPNSRLIVGTLSGGGASCSTPNSPDCFGKFSISWASGSSPATRLREWLDPLNTGATSVPGQDPRLSVAIMAESATLISEGCQPTNGVIDPGETVTIRVTLRNNGGVSTTNLVATLLATNGVTAPGAAQTYGAMATGTPVSREFTFTAAGVCGGRISPTLQLQDGSASYGTVSFNFTLGKPVVSYSERFDSVSAPSLPSGWTASVTGTGAAWATATTQNDTPPNAAFALNAASVSDNLLTSPSIFITNSGAQLTFRHRYALEAGFDGGVLEISVGGGGFTDIITAGGSFVEGGYNGTISTLYGNPLRGRQAWTGSSGSFITTTVNLPASTAGNNVRFRWRLGCDQSLADAGWYVDTVAVWDGYACCVGLQPPLITQQPQSQTVPPGTNVNFEVVATGTAPLGYQWRINGTNILNATNSILSLSNVTPVLNGNYDVVVANSAGAVTSSVAVLTVTTNLSLPVITQQPQSQTVSAGTNVMLAVGATGLPPLLYQWRFNGTNILGATNASLPLVNVQTNQSGNYDVIVANAAGSVTSAVAVLTVIISGTPPAITQQPQSQSVAAGANVQLSVVATGTAPLSYQWRFGGTPLNNATSAVLILNNIQPGQAGNYDVVVSNPFGAVTSAIAQVTISALPVITVQPQNQIVFVGDSVVFSVVASGTPPLSYQWRHNGVDIPGANTAALVLPAVSPSDAGSYYVVVGNAAGSVNSAVASLTVNSPPYIMVQPQDQTVMAGSTVSFVVSAGGSPPMSYQWYFAGGAIPGANGGGLSLTNVQLANAGEYYVIISNAYGSARSGIAYLNVLQPIPLQQALNSTNSWITTEAAPWFGQFSVTHDGQHAAQSGAIGNNGKSILETTVTGPGIVYFWWKVSSQTNGDYLHFSIGNTVRRTISGEVDWTQVAMLVPSGPQKLTWTYIKNAAGTAGADAGWVDQVEFYPLRAAFNFKTRLLFSLRMQTQPGFTYTLEATESPASGPWTSITSMQGDGTEKVFLDPFASTPRRFYRIRVE